MEQIAQRSLPHIDAPIQGEKDRASMAPEVATVRTEENQGATLLDRDFDRLFPQIAQGRKSFTTKLEKEKKVCTAPSYHRSNIVPMT